MTKITSDKYPRKAMKVNDALRTVILQAGTAGRLTHGVIPCTKLLHACPGRIMLCILPTCNDFRPFQQTHQKLIEAYCREKHVRLLQVDSVEKLRMIMQKSCDGQSPTDVDLEINGPQQTTGAACLLIEQPASASREDDFVLTYHDTLVSCHVVPLPLVHLPE